MNHGWLLDVDSSAKNEAFSLSKIIQKPTHIINFNWASILFFSFFLAYGYYGALTPEISQFKESPTTSALTLCLLTVILVLLGLLAWKAPARFQDSIKIRRRDFIVYLSYFVILFSFLYNQLQFSLYSDEISYSATSHGHSIHISLALVKQLYALDGIAFQYLVQAISLILLTSLLGLFILSKRLTWRSRIIIFSLLLILGRLAFTYTGGNGSPHPPLHLIPPFIFGSVFGITDFAFKFSYFAIYVIFILVLYRMILRVFPFAQSYLLALAIGTIPLLWHMAGVVDHSLWASVSFTLVIVEVATSIKLNYIRLFSFISIAVMMRQPSFLAILPVLMLFIYEEFKYNEWRNCLTKSIFMLTPALLFIPFLGKSLISGTPSTDALNTGSMLRRVFDAVDSDIVWSSITNSVPYWWIIFIPLAFIPLSGRMVSRNIILLFFFSTAVCVYYSIHPSLWGYAKYQAEYAVPFAIIGMLLLAVRLSTFHFARRAVATLALIIIVLNISDFMRIPKDEVRIAMSMDTNQRASEAKHPGEHYLVAFPYNYRAAYDAIKKEGLTENSYSIGSTYGILPEIMNGYSIKSIRAVHDIFVDQEHNRQTAPAAGWDIEYVESDDRIKVVLIGLVSGKQKLIDGFKTRSWSVMGEYKNHQYGTSVVALKRPVA
ncbi:MAG: hypothetical protein WD823_11210 [Sulfuricaulis sp.]|uniref:hypothetical protein n=1 Tax=Sulfuricaulis sp. TaxID=2003553 RepID=UPI0034A5C783